jgi:hypothetical protein
MGRRAPPFIKLGLLLTGQDCNGSKKETNANEALIGGPPVSFW